MPRSATRRPATVFEDPPARGLEAPDRPAFVFLEPPAWCASGGPEAAESRAAPSALPDRRGPRLLELRLPENGPPTPADPVLLRFDEPVVAGPGRIVLKSSGHAIAIPARDADQVAIEGALVRLVPESPLEPGARYVFEFSRKAFCDLAGNPMRPVSAAFLPTLAVAANPSAQGQSGTAAWTLMVYMAADNDLEPYALLDLAEMERIRLPENVNLVALVDASPYYGRGPLDFADTRRGPVRFDGDPRTTGAELVSIGERNTGDPATLTEFLEWARATFPAERYGLVVWDHGGGLEGAAWDFSSRGDRLELSELRRAITESGIERLDFLGFDACLMAMAEVAGEFSDLARVLVASQDLEPNAGWAYDRWLAALARDPDLDPRALARAAVETYAAAYPNRRDITLSALDLEAMPRLERALDAFVDTVASAADAAERAALARAVAEARPFPRDASYPYRDLGGFLRAVERRLDDPAIDEAARAARAALDDLVIARAGTVRAASGLSIHLPEPREPPWHGYGPEQFAFLERVGWDDLFAAPPAFA
ncbi:MAG: clostripain-related cysteine peptidase [Geminicoccaceae bacterium]|nr:clostripain-related cysteine peptidase [Geminicoccaceae bacterium]